MRKLLAPFLAISLLASQPALAAYEIGDTIDDFSLPNLQGELISLTDFDGQVVLINFFATWCPPCNEEVPLLQNMYQTYESSGLVILGIDLLEPPATVEAWVQANQLSYPIVLAADWDLFQLFPGAGGFPYNAVLDRNRVLHYSQYGINMEEIEVLVQELLLEDPVDSESSSMGAIKALFR